MAKPLREPPPSSSVAHLFDVGAAARAVATPVIAAAPSSLATVSEPQPVARSTPLEPAPRSAQPSMRTATGERPTIKRTLVLTPSANATFSRLVELYQRTTGTRLTDSHVARAMFRGIEHCMETLEREARRLGPQKLPANGRGHELDRERFEARIADAFVAGVRAASSLESE